MFKAANTELGKRWINAPLTPFQNAHVVAWMHELDQPAREAAGRCMAHNEERPKQPRGLSCSNWIAVTASAAVMLNSCMHPALKPANASAGTLRICADWNPTHA